MAKKGKKNYKLDEIEKFVIPDPAVSIFMRVNREQPDGTFDPIYWGDAAPDKRFSVKGLSQLYLTTSLEALSEATPWRRYVDPAMTASVEVPLDESDLEGYWISYISPNWPIVLLDLTKNQQKYGASYPQLLDPEDKSESSNFAEQTLTHSSGIGGILYPSQFDSDAKNIIIFDSCKKHFSEDSCIASRKLVDVVRPMKDVLRSRIGIEFLI